MKLCILALFALIGTAMSLEINTVTGTTAPPCAIPDDFCAGKVDGNYNHPSLPNYFITCAPEHVSCTPCWPLKLFFSQSCNQCLYAPGDACYTTQVWEPHTTFTCPKNYCEVMDEPLSGNFEDAAEERHYIGCWEGITMGCVVCPAGLKYNQPWNACLHRGLYETIEDIDRAVVIQLIDSPNCLSASSADAAEFVACDNTPTDNDNKRQKFYFDDNSGHIKNAYYHRCLKKSDADNTYVLADCMSSDNFELGEDLRIRDGAGNCIGGGSSVDEVPTVDAGCGNQYSVRDGEQ